MSLDLHPEELLYQQSRRDLSADEQADLARTAARAMKAKPLLAEIRALGTTPAATIAALPADWHENWQE